MALKTRLSKLEKVERERLCGEVLAAEATIRTLAGKFFNEAQLLVLNVLFQWGDSEARDLPLEELQNLYARRRQQLPIESLRWALDGHQWLIAKLQALQTKQEAKNAAA